MIFLITVESFLTLMFCLILSFGKKQFLKLFQDVSVMSRYLYTSLSEVMFSVFLYNFLWVYVSQQVFSVQELYRRFHHLVVTQEQRERNTFPHRDFRNCNGCCHFLPL